MPLRLKTTEVAAWRSLTLTAQHGRCAICGLPCSESQAVADHDHSSGAMRASLHRGCNALLGKIENNHKRYGVPDVRAFTNGVAAYLTRHSVNITGYSHPSFRTEDEKRVRRNAVARKARASKKAA